MNTLSYKGFEGSAEIDTELDVCRGKLLFIPDLVTYEAPSAAELKTEFEAAVDDYLDTCRELGREPHRPYKGSFNVRVEPEMHRDAVLYAARKGSKLNDVVVQGLRLVLYTSEPQFQTLVMLDARGGMQSLAAGSEPVKALLSAQTSSVSYVN